MHRILFYVLKNIAFLCRLFSDKLYMKFIILAYESKGVVFEGKPEYIDYASYIDPSGGLTIGNRVVISTKVIILTHDWSFLVRYHAQPSSSPYTHLIKRLLVLFALVITLLLVRELYFYPGAKLENFV